MKGYIFRCNDKTKDEVFSRQLFGEERDYLEIVKQIKKEDLLFLYNTSTFEFTGPFKPASNGGKFIVLDAWQNKFPSQIKIITIEQTNTIPFTKIEGIIKKYKNGIYPAMELEQDQVTKILSKI